MITLAELELIRQWDAKCGDNETTFFPVTKDRRRLLEHAEELRALLLECRDPLQHAGQTRLIQRIDTVLGTDAVPALEAPAVSHASGYR
jgi:hypothetical protein